MNNPVSIFKRTKKAKAPDTMQAAQQEFNNVLFRIGAVYYQKHMKKAELTQADSMLNSLIQKADKLGQTAQSLQAKAQAELAKEVVKGQTSASEEGTANAPKAV